MNFLSLDICNSSGVLRVIYFLKILFSIIVITLPIIIIITSSISIFKTVLDGKTDSLKSSIMISFKRIIAGIIVLLLPTLINYIFNTLTTNNVEFATCYTNANLDYIKNAEEQERKEMEAEKAERIEQRKEYEALQRAKLETHRQSNNNYNNGGDLEGEVLTNGTSGTYFAPFQDGSHRISGASLTGGCKNEEEVFHDISASVGTPVYAPYDGTAQYIQSNCSGYISSYGNQVRVYKEDGTYIIYAHFSKFPDGIEMPITNDCKDDDSPTKCGAGHCSDGMTSTKVAEVKVKKGQLIGYTGNSGNSEGPHLHVEIHEEGSKYCVTDPWAAFGMR